MLSEPVFRWEVAFVLFSKKNPYNVMKGVTVLVNEGRNETPIISEVIRFDFGVNQIIETVSFLFLLTHIGLNFNEKVLE